MYAQHRDRFGQTPMTMVMMAATQATQATQATFPPLFFGDLHGRSVGAPPRMHARVSRISRVSHVPYLPPVENAL
jgi:hypothetical protein